jgi:hypothetical protein
VLAGLEWDILMDAFDAARRQVPSEQWLDVRYEDVLANPRVELGRMLDFSGLDWTPEFETAFARYQFGSGRSDAFRKDLGSRALGSLEPVIARNLLANGYTLTA